MSRPLTFYEFFAGGGMARLGLGEGWRCLFANDFDPVKARTYRANFEDAEEHFREGDVWTLEASDLPGQADLAWASSPCQDFSLAGARAGLKGTRSSAFFGFWRLIEALNAEGRAPRAIVVENVVGLLTSHGGADFEALCRAFVNAGYRIGALELDASRFIPQSRPRLFMIASKVKPDEALTQIEPTLPFHSKRVQTAFDALSHHLKSHWVWWRLPFPPAMNSNVSAHIFVGNEEAWLAPTKLAKLVSYLSPLHTEKLDQAKRRRARVVGTVFRRMRKENGVSVQRAEIRFDGFAGCLRTPSGGSSKQFVMVVQGEEVKARPISAREGASLMGLDENYELPQRENAALKVVGDGVAVPVVKFIEEQLLRPLLVEKDSVIGETQER